MNFELIISGAGLLLGGLSVKLFDWFTSGKRTLENNELREIRAELNDFRERIALLEKEVSHWRGLYYTEVEKRLGMRMELETDNGTN